MKASTDQEAWTCYHTVTADGYQPQLVADASYSIMLSTLETPLQAFNLTADPHEMKNLVHDPAAQEWISTLRARLQVLKNCTQDECW
jgi:hypothetical protein